MNVITIKKTVDCGNSVRAELSTGETIIIKSTHREYEDYPAAGAKLYFWGDTVVVSREGWDRLAPEYFNPEYMAGRDYYFERCE